MKYLIIDGLNLFIRNFVVVPAMDTDGNPIGGLVGFLRTTKRLIAENSPDGVIVCWDGEGGSRMRRGVFAEYKQGRKVRINRTYDNESPKDSADNMGDQLTKLRKLLGNMGVLQLEASEVEADDAIAFLCTYVIRDEEQKVIVTSDRDMLQLVGPNTLVYSPSKKIYWTSAEVKEKIGVLPENYIFVKALMGDTSDNIPGIGGIGEKTAVKLFPFLAERPATFDEIFSHAKANEATGTKYKSVLDKWDQLRENVKLMQLSSPIFSLQASRAFNAQMEQPLRFSMTDLRLELTRLGVDGLDLDFFGVLNSYRNRAEKR